MHVKLEIERNKINVLFDEDMCIDLTVMPDFVKQVESIYNNYLCVCLSDKILKNIECELTRLLHICRERGALMLGEEVSFFRDNEQMLHLKQGFVFDNHFIEQITKFQFVFGA